jgi:DsbC/DsbD-like thiol-disulfide interchange protein
MRDFLKFSLTFFLAAFCLISNAQSDQKVKWQYVIEKKGKGIYILRMTAVIDKGWHLYSQQQSADAIALPTTITFTKNPFIELKGKPSEEGKLYYEIEAATRTRSRYYANKVVFVQQLKLKKNIKTTVNGDIEFMVCDDKQCLPPGTVKFSVKLQ